ncbi:MAG: LytTR family DNA-binding domain-containing protein, partial [Bacteroidota bacterium]
YKYPFLWGYGAVIAGVLLFMRFLIPRLVPKVFREAKWTVAKHILYLFVSFYLAVVACYLYYCWFFEDPLRWADLAGFSLTSATIGVFPLTAYVMISYIRLLKKYQKGAAQFNAHKDFSQSTISTTTPTLSLTNEQDKVQLEVPINQLFFLQSSLNYVEVFFQVENQLKKELIRNSFQKIEDQLPADFFIRCHRSYIVNLDNVKEISGNAQGYKLHLNAHDLMVPVSRSKSKEVLERLK